MDSQADIDAVVKSTRRKITILRLKEYPELKVQIEQKIRECSILRFAIDGLKSTELSNMSSHGTNVSDPTYEQVLMLPNFYKEIDDIKAEIEIIKEKVKAIDEAILYLTPAEYVVIKNRYIDPPKDTRKKSYCTLACEYRYAESTLKNAHTTAINKISRLLKVGTQ